jgi:hypothetical protein
MEWQILQERARPKSISPDWPVNQPSRKQFRQHPPEINNLRWHEPCTDRKPVTLRLTATETSEEESMHNIDRTNLESNYGEYAGEYATEYPGEYSGEYMGEHEYMGEDEYAGEYPGEYATEYQGEYQGEYPGEYGQETETYGEYAQESPFSEAEEMELAAELLTVQSEVELEQFLGKLIKKAGGFLKSGVGRQLTGALRGIAKKALPVLGGAAGNFLLPGVGGAIGSKLASAAGNMFGLELEGLSYEDQEFEVAKQVVRLGGAAANNAAQAPPTAPPAQAAQAALTSAAQQFAPGLLRPGAGPSGMQQRRRCRHRNTGRWVRSRNGIVLLGT